MSLDSKFSGCSRQLCTDESHSIDDRVATVKIAVASFRCLHHLSCLAGRRRRNLHASASEQEQETTKTLPGNEIATTYLRG